MLYLLLSLGAERLGDHAKANTYRAEIRDGGQLRSYEKQIRDAMSKRPPTPTVRKPKPTAVLSVKRRREWNARAIRAYTAESMGQITRLTVHHSATPIFSTDL